MDDFRSLWLVINAASGSNDEDSAAQLAECCARSGIRIERIIRFPDDDLPAARTLDEAGMPLVAVFAGDGTVNALVTSLYGWSGAVLVLPGGPKSLLFRGLHGEREPQEVLDAVAAGATGRCRPAVIRCERGDGLGGVMAGPGTAWADVREAMRHADIAAMASGAAHAIEQSLAAPTIACRDPALGREEGYPLLELTPGEAGFAVDAYYSETVADYLAQGLALLKFDFREGPSDRLGELERLTVENCASEPIGLLIDGEPAEGGPKVQFELAACEVDLLASAFDE